MPCRRPATLLLVLLLQVVAFANAWVSRPPLSSGLPPQQRPRPRAQHVLRASLLHELPSLLLLAEGTSFDDLANSLPKISIDDAKNLYESFPKPEIPSNLLQSLPKVEVPPQLQDALKAVQESTPGALEGLKGSLKAVQEGTPGALEQLKGLAQGLQGTVKQLQEGGGVQLPSLDALPSLPSLDSVPLSDEVKGQISAIQGQVGDAVGSKLSGLGSAVTEQLDKVLGPYQPLIDQTKGQLGERFSVVTKLADQLTQEVSKDAENLSPALGVLQKVATPRNVFNTENLVTFPFWVSVILAPGNPLVKGLMKSYLPVLAAVSVYIWTAYLAFQDPATLQGFSGITDLGVLSKGLGTEIGTTTAWAHFIAQDLFVGRWIYLDGLRNGVWTAHSLTLAFLFGPTGILSHLLTRGVVKVFRWDVEDIMSAGTQSVAPSAADDAARSMIKDAEKQSKSALRAADKQAESVVKKAQAEARKIVVEARRQAEGALASESKIISSAEAQAQRILDDARKKADQLMAKAASSTPPPAPSPSPSVPTAAAKGE